MSTGEGYPQIIIANNYIHEKKSLDEQNIKLEQKQNDWIEPMENWIKVASNLEKIARDNNLFEKKVAAEQVFGSNLRLAAREARGTPQNQWAAHSAAHEMADQKSESQILERVTGIEPVSLDWQPSVIATILYPLIKIPS